MKHHICAFLLKDAVMDPVSLSQGSTAISFFKTFLIIESTNEMVTVDGDVLKVVHRQALKNNQVSLSLKSAQDLHNAIISQHGYKDNSDDDNFKLNRLFMD